MKTKILIVAFTVAVIASFSFITINKNYPKENQSEISHQPEPLSGFVMEDHNQF